MYSYSVLIVYNNEIVNNGLECAIIYNSCENVSFLLQLFRSYRFTRAVGQAMLELDCNSKAVAHRA